MNTRPLLLVLPLLLGSCGGGGADVTAQTNAGYQALGSQDWAGARADFQDALDAMGGDTGHAQYLRAKMGLLNALAHLDAQKAVDEFNATVASGAQVTDREYSQVGNYLMEAGASAEAIELMDLGMKAYPESKQLAQLKDKLVAASSANPELAEQLKGLGYL